MSRFVSLKNKKREYLDTTTGEVVSKRFRDTTLRSQFSEKRVSNEAAAAMAKRTTPELAVSRPARGRTSLLKKTQTEREFIAAARIEAEQKKIEQHKAVLAENARLRMLARKANKKVTRKNISARLLKAGRTGARVPFNSYEEYLIMLEQAKKVKEITFYGLGMTGFNENTGEEYNITVFTMEYIKNKPIKPEVFEEEYRDAIESRVYFVFQYYWMFLAFDKKFAASKRDKAKAKGRK